MCFPQPTNSAYARWRREDSEAELFMTPRSYQRYVQATREKRSGHHEHSLGLLPWTFKFVPWAVNMFWEVTFEGPPRLTARGELPMRLAKPWRAIEYEHWLSAQIARTVLDKKPCENEVRGVSVLVEEQANIGWTFGGPFRARPEWVQAVTQLPQGIEGKATPGSILGVDPWKGQRRRSRTDGYTGVLEYKPVVEEDGWEVQTMNWLYQQRAMDFDFQHMLLN
ncbi:hypothetical protein DFH27DRAFT_615415 [Peziza echinospora]|nr:hypothetical protein DFH27DRAFT_615415 [Peziza echinospora]